MGDSPAARALAAAAGMAAQRELLGSWSGDSMRICQNRWFRPA